jgi:hypothetical protein
MGGTFVCANEAGMAPVMSAQNKSKVAQYRSILIAPLIWKKQGRKKAPRGRVMDAGFDALQRKNCCTFLEGRAQSNVCLKACSSAGLPLRFVTPSIAD